MTWRVQWYCEKCQQWILAHELFGCPRCSASPWNKETLKVRLIMD